MHPLTGFSRAWFIGTSIACVSFGVDAFAAPLARVEAGTRAEQLQAQIQNLREAPETIGGIPKEKVLFYSRLWPLQSFANISVAIVAGIHFLIMAMELFAWKLPAVHDRLGFSQAEANKAAPIVANAGLYNGFLAAGLVWSLVGTGDPFAIKVFFLSCVIIAGVLGAVTLKWTTLLLQSVPASVALLLTWLATSA